MQPASQNQQKSGTSEGRRRRNAAALEWPGWEPPKDDEILALAHVVARYARFLMPEVVSAVVEDNTRHANDWRSLLDERHIDPDIYLWEGSPCAFPGVRRCAGKKERRDLRKPVTVTGPHPHCLHLDDNDYPKHLWAFVFTGKKFSKLGPNEYHLAHLADHKVYGNRWREEFAFEGDRPLPFGLFASAANTIFVPATLMKPTDFSPELRALLLRRRTSCIEASADSRHRQSPRDRRRKGIGT